MVVVLPGKNQQRPLLRMISWVHMDDEFKIKYFGQHVPQLSMMIYDYSDMLQKKIFMIVHDLPTKRIYSQLPNISSGWHQAKRDGMD